MYHINEKKAKKRPPHVIKKRLSNVFSSYFLGLQAMHTVFAREHNRLAKAIKALAWQKSDEDIMYEARRYVVAQMQNIVYSEFLPAILSKNDIEKYQLDTNQSYYNESTNPVMFIEFTTAAFRMGHSLVTSLINVYKNIGKEKVLHVAI